MPQIFIRFLLKIFNERLFLLASPASSISSSSRVRVFDTRSFAPGCLGPSGSIFVGTHPKCARTKDSVRYRGSRWLLFSATTATSRLIERVVRRKSTGREVSFRSKSKF